MVTASFWAVATNLLLPPAVTLSLLLSLGRPRYLHTLVLRVSLAFRRQTILSLPLTRFIVLFVAICAVFAHLAVQDAQKWVDAESHPGILSAAPTMACDRRFLLLGKKWRAERNFWISLCCVLAWIMFDRILHWVERCRALEEREREREKEREKERERESATTRGPSGAVPPAAIRREDNQPESRPRGTTTTTATTATMATMAAGPRGGPPGSDAGPSESRKNK